MARGAAMSVSTVNISFQEELLGQIDDVAKTESRSRSELIREAARLYLERKQRWQSLFALGSKVGAKVKLTESDLVAEIKDVRKRGKATR
jgi:metal-responsive CopG/Arc/MetJ family transcriptional regulator